MRNRAILETTGLKMLRRILVHNMTKIWIMEVIGWIVNMNVDKLWYPQWLHNNQSL